MTGASIETTLELWASSLREVKKRMRPLFEQDRTALNAGLFVDVSRYHQLPFLVGHIARIAQLAAVIARAIPARPHRCPLESRSPHLNHN